ncbi:MAG: helix-turn-helix domain-containing protein, partial [Deltaproteobacteria bacterium]|nr:helix-turn-helix domain-containing protein [Deltaproteobacteria bacterium]
MKEVDVKVGSKIRAFRMRKALSLVDLAQMTGIAASNLSSIELNKSSPTLHTLVKIAHAFGLRIGEFLDGVMYTKAVLCPKAAPEAAKSTSSGHWHHSLTSEVPFSKMDASVIVFQSTLDREKQIEPGTDRFVYCLEGEITASVDDQTYPLTQGDGLYLLPEAIA